MSWDDDLNALHADCDEAFGVLATYQPLTGPPVTGLRVELDRPDIVAGLTNAKSAQADWVLRVRCALLPGKPKKGDVFALPSMSVRVTEVRARDDVDAKRWVLDVAEVGG